MNFDIILKASEEFKYIVKESGLLKYPQELYDKMYLWMREVLYMMAAGLLEDKINKNLYNIEILKKNIKRYKKYNKFNSQLLEDFENYIQTPERLEIGERGAAFNLITSSSLQLDKEKDIYVLPITYLTLSEPDVPRGGAKGWKLTGKGHVDFEFEYVHFEDAILHLKVYIKESEYNIDNLEQEIDYNYLFDKNEFIFYNVAKQKSKNIDGNSTKNFNYDGYYIALSIEFKKDEPQNEIDTAEGYWSGANVKWLIYGNENYLGNIHINIPKEKLANYNQWSSVVGNSKITLRHELQHAMQTYIKRKKQLPEEGGLPSAKIRSKDFDTRGFKPGVNEKDQPHILRDVEFYTDLSDAVASARVLLKKYPKIIHKKIIDAVINSDLTVLNTLEYDDSELSQKLKVVSDITYAVERCYAFYFFKNLYAGAPLKYQKAVKEFLKVLASEGYF